MRRSISTLAAALLLSFLPGCLLARNTVNQPFTTEATQDFVVGETTAAQVAEALGAPNEVVQLGRRSAWRYEFVRSKRAGLFLLVVNLQNGDTREDRIWVFFDQDDVLSHWGSTYQADDVRFAMPWQETSGEAAEDDAQEPTPDETTPEEPGA